MKSNLFAFISFSFCSFGCGEKPVPLPPTPTGASIEGWLAPEVVATSKGRLRLVSANPTSTKFKEESGIRMLTVYFDYRLEFTEDCQAYKDMLQIGHFETFFPAKEKRRPGYGVPDQILKGETVDKKGRALYLDNGTEWVKSPFNIAQDDRKGIPVSPSQMPK